MIKTSRTQKRVGLTPAAYAGLILVTASVGGCTRNQLAETAYLSLQQRECLVRSRESNCPPGEPSYREYQQARRSFGPHCASPALNSRPPGGAERKPLSRELAHVYGQNRVASVAPCGMMA